MMLQIYEARSQAPILSGPKGGTLSCAECPANELDSETAAPEHVRSLVWARLLPQAQAISWAVQTWMSGSNLAFVLFNSVSLTTLDDTLSDLQRSDYFGIICSLRVRVAPFQRHRSCGMTH
jgi:hypothetical protein